MRDGPGLKEHWKSRLPHSHCNSVGDGNEPGPNVLHGAPGSTPLTLEESEADLSL